MQGNSVALQQALYRSELGALNCVSEKHIWQPSPLVPVNVTWFGNTVFAVQLGWSYDEVPVEWGGVADPIASRSWEEERHTDTQGGEGHV